MLRTTRKERRSSAVGRQANHQYPSEDDPFLDSLLLPFTFEIFQGFQQSGPATDS